MRSLHLARCQEHTYLVESSQAFIVNITASNCDVCIEYEPRLKLEAPDEHGELRYWPACLHGRIGPQ